MEQLENTKAKSITIPKIVNRYAVAYYSKAMGWQMSSQLFTTPESAIEDFLRFNNFKKKDDYTPRFYKVIEIELEIPVILPEL